ncbi:MAG: DegV family protein [Anaerolineales bacterium]|nr:DegV family protein [Anaerolineales bacterium]
MGGQNIVVVTDSSAYIPAEAIGDLNIPVIPLWLLWDGDHYRDGVDISPVDFYRRLRTSKTFPSSSQPAPGEFVEFFRSTASGADVIVAVMVSSRISATYENARKAVTQLPDLNIHVVDSYNTSMGLGFSVLAAARAAAAGKSVEDVIQAAEKIKDRVHFLFAVDTLEFLHRGGRIGAAKRLVGTALQIKPLLEWKDGIIQPLCQARTKRKALARMLDEAETRLAGKPMAEVVVVDVDTPVEGDAVAEQVGERFHISRVLRSTVSPVVGTHAGPGSVGLVFYSED